MLRVATWNVLHRVHAENWGEDHVVACFPSEPARVATIANDVARLVATYDAVALQEVSGDQLRAVEAASPGATVVAVPYPRVPRPKRVGGARLDDPREFLVVVAAGGAVWLHAEVAPDDPGKGFLALRLAGGPVVVNTHVAGKDRGPLQVRRVAAYARAVGAAALVGDFNMTHAALAPLVDGLHLAAAVEGLSTRQSAPQAPGRWIDHGLSATGGVTVLEVWPGGYASDHRVVGLGFRG